MLLPHNNTVLIAGGTSAGATLKSVERFVHWDWTVVSESNSMAAERSGAVGVPTSRDGVALVAGGGSAQAELYGFATLKTDKDDYAPGEIVTFTGSGWQPGETVTLTISEDADSHNDFEFTAVADEFGNIVNNEFYPREDDTYHHMGMRFYAMAKGIASEAQTTFTDGGTLTITLAGNGTGSVSGSGAGHQPGDFAGCTSPAVVCSLVYTSNGEAVLTASPASGSTFQGWSGASCSGTGTCTVKMDGNKAVTATFTKAEKATPIVTVTGGAFPYDGAAHAATAEATVNGVSVAGTISLTYNGDAAAPVNAGTYAVVASFTPTDVTNYNPATGNGSITIEKATPTVTVTGGPFTYDGQPHAASASAMGVNNVSLVGTFSFTYNGASAEPVNAGTYAVVASFTPTDVTNYNPATGNGSITIKKATPAVTVTGGPFTYDGQPHAASASAMGVDNVSLVGAFSFTYNGASAEPVNAGTYAVVASFTPTDVTNYNPATGNGSITIEQATPIVTVTGGTFTYDGTAHPATAAAKGLITSTWRGRSASATTARLPRRSTRGPMTSSRPSLPRTPSITRPRLALARSPSSRRRQSSR